MSRTRALWLCIGICIAGVALRSYHLDVRSIWFDESFTWRIIHFPISELMRSTVADVHPPLYYVLVKGWAVIFGSSLLALRSFSVFCSAISLIGAYLFTSEAFRSRRAGLFASGMLAVSPWAIAYAWEARMYTLGMTLALFSSYALIRGIRSKKIGWFLLYGTLAAAFAYTHYYGLLTIVSQAVAIAGIVLWHTKFRIGEIIQSHIFWGSVGGLMLTLALFSPWVPSFLAQQSRVQQSYWVPRIGATSVPDTLYRLFVPTIDLPARHGFMAGVLVLPFAIILCIWGVLALWRKKETQDGAYATLALGAVPFLLGITISLGSRSLYNDRFFAFAGIFIFIAIAGIVDRISYARIRTGIIVACILFSTLAYVRSWRELDIARSPGVHGAIRFVMDERGNNQPILTSSPYIYFPLMHYTQEEFHVDSVLHLYSAQGGFSHFSGAPITLPGDIVRDRDIAEYVGTVWVVDTTGFTEKHFIAPTNWHEQLRKVFPEVFVYQGDIIVRKFIVLSPRT